MALLEDQIEEAQAAFVAAHEAKDAEGAQVLADHIRELQAQKDNVDKAALESSQEGTKLTNPLIAAGAGTVVGATVNPVINAIQDIAAPPKVSAPHPSQITTPAPWTPPKFTPQGMPVDPNVPRDVYHWMSGNPESGSTGQHGGVPVRGRNQLEAEKLAQEYHAKNAARAEFEAKNPGRSILDNGLEVNKADYDYVEGMKKKNQDAALLEHRMEQNAAKSAAAKQAESAGRFNLLPSTHQPTTPFSIVKGGAKGAITGASIADIPQQLKQGNFGTAAADTGIAGGNILNSLGGTPRRKAIGKLIGIGSGILRGVQGVNELTGAPEEQKAEGGLVHLAGGGQPEFGEARAYEPSYNERIRDAIAPHIGMQQARGLMGGQGADAESNYNPLSMLAKVPGSLAQNTKDFIKSGEEGDYLGGVGSYISGAFDAAPMLGGAGKLARLLNYQIGNKVFEKGSEIAAPYAEKAIPHIAKAIKFAKNYLPESKSVLAGSHLPGYAIGGDVIKGSANLAKKAFNYDKYKLSQVYPDVIPPVMATDAKTGKEFLQKQLSPEAIEVQKARKAAQKQIDVGNYQPHFDINQRYYVDPSHYPTAGYTQTDIVPKKADTIAKYTELANNPESLARLRGAFEKGKDRPAAKDWYAMGQLEDAFIKELGPEEGRKQFKARFADAMAATTGGADPNSNLMMAAFTNYQKGLGKEIPTKAADLPFPIGGRFVSGNMEQAKKLAEMGEIPVTNPKRHNFSANFLGHRDVSTLDEQMSQLWDPKMMSPPPNAYGIYQAALAKEAEKAGVNPVNFQDVAWAGAKDYPGKPMMQEINEMLARTHAVTGEPQEEILKGFIHGNKPMYGIGAVGGLGSLDTTEEQKYAAGGKVGAAKKLFEEAQAAYKAKFTPDFYHGSPSNKIKEFDPTHPSSEFGSTSTIPNATFLTKDPSFANSFLPSGGAFGYRPQSTVYPVNANLGKHFDYETPEGKTEIKKYVSQVIPVPMGDKISEKEMQEWMQNRAIAHRALIEGDWSAVEHPRFQQHLKDAGYNSFAIQEAGRKNVGIYEPQNIRGKFAKFNPEDAANPDFMKAEGGSVQHFQAGKRVLSGLSQVAKYAHGQDPKVAQALEEYLKGNISQEERIRVMNQFLPMRQWNELPPNYSDEQIRNALMSNKQEKALAPVPAGMRVGNRLDIPAYTQNGVYVDTTHGLSGNKSPISYNRTGHLTDVDFSSKPDKAVRVGLGTRPQALTPMAAEYGADKSPFALIQGTNVGTSDDEVRRMMAEMMKDPNYTQIGMDPRKHSQFYDKQTGMPVFSAEEKLQSGPLIIAPKKGLETTSWDDPRLNLSDFPGKKYAPGGKVVGGLSELMQLITQRGGSAAAQRLERAADLVPNLENKFQPQALKSAFTGDNASAVMVMKPGDFERYAVPLGTEHKASLKTPYNLGVFTKPEDLHTVPRGSYEEYLEYLSQYAKPGGGGFSSVPFLNLGQLKGSSFPNIQGHEGRHRTAALEKLGDKSTLVQMIPTPNLREPFPRRSQEEYLNALKQKIGNKPMVTPEQTEEGLSRGLIELPEMFKKGGKVKKK